MTTPTRLWRVTYIGRKSQHQDFAKITYFHNGDVAKTSFDSEVGAEPRYPLEHIVLEWKDCWPTPEGALRTDGPWTEQEVHRWTRKQELASLSPPAIETDSALRGQGLFALGAEQDR